MARTDRRRRALRFGAGAAVTAVTFLVGSAIVAPGVFAPWFGSGPTGRLDRPCAGVTAGTVAAAVPSAKRQVDTLPDGWEWTCRWRSTAAATLRTANPTLTVRAERLGWRRGGRPEVNAAKRYGELAVKQVSDSRFGEDDVKARRLGLGVQVVDGIGDRAQVYVEPSGVGTTGYRATAAAVRGNVVVVSRYVSYRATPAEARDRAVAAAREAVAAL